MFITVIEFKLDTNSRRPSHISVSVVGAGWGRAPGSAAATEVLEAWGCAARAAAAVSIWSRVPLVSVRLPGVVPSFPSRSQCPRPAVPLQVPLQVLQVALQIEIHS